MLFANFPNFGSNEGVPSRGHAWEQMMFHLEVESTSDGARNESTISARSLNLCLEPIHGFLFATLLALQNMSRITIGIDKVVRQGKENGQEQTFGSTQKQNVAHDAGIETFVHDRMDNMHIDIIHSQQNCPLSTAHRVIIVHFDSHTQGSALSEIKNFWVEDLRKPVSSQNNQVKEHLEAMVPFAFGVPEGVVMKEQKWFRSKGIRILFSVIGVGVMSPVLLHPEPFAATDKVSAQTQNIVDDVIL
mmetsp:Transcript_18233/g.43076  ORF Transcript_18233/g.43076 Transcript_18233/m.43076 type:complete len:246 (+) Transcript_18233:171-908(+)